MGWSYTNREKGISHKGWFAKVFNGELVDLMGNGLSGPLYGALRTDAGHVIGLEILINWSSGYYNFGYNSMTESMGPIYAQAPRRIIEQLSPLDEWLEPGTSSYNWARRWRETSLWYAQQLEKPALKVGDLVHFYPHLDYGVWGERSVLEVAKTGRQKIFKEMDGYPRFRVHRESLKWGITHIIRDGRTIWTRPERPIEAAAE